MNNPIRPRRGSLLLLALGLLVPFSAVGQEADRGPATGEGHPELAIPAPDEAESAASKEEYLAPLQALVPDEVAFADTLEALGDTEIIRLDNIDTHLRLRQLTQEESIALRQEMRMRLERLEWLCEIGLANHPQNAKVRNFRGTVLYDNFGKQADGLNEWYTAISLDSAYGQPYNNLGMHYFHAGNYALGFQNMDKALKLEPNNPDFCFNMAQNYLIFIPQSEKERGWSKKRVYNEAMKLSRNAIKNAPTDYQLLEDYAVNFFAARNFGVKASWKDAAKAWEAAREHAPDGEKLFYTWLNEGRAWKELGRKKDARHCFEKALEILPGNEVVTRLIQGLDDDA